MPHSRKKSASANTSLTDVRKALNGSTTVSTSKRSTTRPSMVRRTTPTAAAKLGKSPRNREKEWEEERWWEEERESFPQFCTTCEKQFVPRDARHLYCSETCRMHDSDNTPKPRSHSNGYIHSPSFYPAPEPRDIVPRASPSRPSSTYFSSQTSPDELHMSAVAALKSLSIRDPSPPSPTLTSTSMWPFSTRSAAASPSTSYSRPTSGVFSSTYDTSYYTTSSGYGTTTSGAERPFPVRRPGSYSRPKSTDLLTSVIGR